MSNLFKKAAVFTDIHFGLKSKPSTLIIYNGGTFGTFLEWCLGYFSGIIESTELPFNQNGNSHKFRGNHLRNMDGFREYCNSENVYPICRIHPKTEKSHSLLINLNECINHVSRGILLYADDDSAVFNLNNKFEKVWAHGWLKENESLIKDNIAKWDGKTLDQMERWELREFLSFFIWQNHLDETEPEVVRQFEHPNLIKIEVKQLLYDFENTIKQCLKFCNLSEARSNYQEIYDAWFPLQIHKDKDQLVKSIVDSIHTDFDWAHEQLSLVDEAIVQMRIRDLYGAELRCYNLNQFPTNSKVLRDLIINE